MSEMNGDPRNDLPIAAIHVIAAASALVDDICEDKQHKADAFDPECPTCQRRYGALEKALNVLRGVKLLADSQGVNLHGVDRVVKDRHNDAWHFDTLRTLP